MRTFKQIYNEYTAWIVNKTGNNEYSYENLIEKYGVQNTHIFLHKDLLNKCYDKDKGMFYFAKFIVGDLKEIGYPNAFRYNALLRKWHNLVSKTKYLAILCARGHGKCQSPNSLISMSDGTQKKLIDVNNGDKIISLDDNYKFNEDVVVHKMKTGEKTEYVLSTNSGKKISCANTHKFYTVNGWKTLSELKIGDFIATPRKISRTINHTISSDMAKLLGWLLSEGRYNTSIEISQTSKENVYSIEQISNNLNLKSTRYYRDNKLTGIRISSKNFKFKELKFCNSYNKRIPKEMFSQPDNIIFDFLSTLFEGDGYFDIRNSSSFSVSYSSMSEGLVNDINHLFTLLGLHAQKLSRPASMITKKFNKKMIVYTLMLNGVECLNFVNNIKSVSKEKARLTIIKKLSSIKFNTNKDVIPKFGIFKNYNVNSSHSFTVNSASNYLSNHKKNVNKTHIRQDYKLNSKKILEHFDSKKLDLLINSDVYWEKIKSIENTDKKIMMYDLEIKNNHNYIANDIVTHNSVFFSQILNLYDMFLFPFRRIILISASQEQANELLENMKLIIENNEWLIKKKDPNRWAGQRIGYNNGYIMTAGIGSEILGQHVDRICVPGHTMIDTVDGNKRIDKIKIGDYVRTHTGNFKKVTKTFLRSNYGNIQKIITPYHELTLTDNHELLTHRGWISAKQIIKGDIVYWNDLDNEKELQQIKFVNKKITNRKQYDNIDIDDEMGMFLGLFAAEGSNRNGNTIAMTFNNSEKEYHELSLKIMKRIGMKTYVDTHNSWSTTIIGYSKSVYDSFELMFNKGAKNKSIPDEIFNSRPSVKANFILGLLYGDGSKTNNGKSFGFGVNSKKLRDDLVKLSKSISITPTIIKTTVNKRKNCFSIYNSETYHCHFRIPFVNKLKAISKSNNYEIISNVKTRNWTGKLYNLEVEKDNSYVANGIIVHNCVDDILRSDNKLSDQQIEDYIDMNLSPMLLNRNGQMILVGTPKSSSDIFNEIERRIKTEPKTPWLLRRYPAVIDYDKKILQCPDRFSWNQIMEKRLTMGALKFGREYQLEFFSRDKSLFPNSVLDAAKRKGSGFSLLEKADNRGKEWIYVMGCLPDGEKVLTNKGEKNIEDVPSENLQLYDKDYKLTNIKNYQRCKYDDYLYEITPSHTKISTKMTKEHPVLIYRDNIEKFLTAEELKKGDFLVFPRKIKGSVDINTTYQNGSGNKKIKIDFTKSFDFGRFLGLYLAEGWIGYGKSRSNRNINIHLGTHETELISFVENFIINKLKRKIQTRIKNNTYSISFNNKWLYNLLKSFGRYAYGKYIPLYYKFSNECKKGIIKGYWDGDGCIKQDKRRNHKIINFVSTSKLLLTNIQHLLYELDIESRLKILRPEGFTKFKNKTHISQTRETYELETSAQEYNKFIKILDLKHLRPNVVNTKYYGKRKMSPIINKNNILIPIQTINKKKFNGYVNNFETVSHTYMNYNLISHNCDVARSGAISADYTVAIVLAYNSITQEKQIVHFWREKGMKISEQSYYIANIAKKFDNCQVLVEQNNIGIDMIDTLADEYNVGVESFVTGGKGQKKEELIRFLITSFEHEQFTFPQQDEWSREQMTILENELTKFCVTTTPAGNERFEGVGSHDDSTISLALANKATQMLGTPFAVTNFNGDGSVDGNPYKNLLSNKGETDLVKLIRMGVIK